MRYIMGISAIGLVPTLGGGFPIKYKSEVIGVRELSEEISAQLDCCFGSNNWSYTRHGWGKARLS